MDINLWIANFRSICCYAIRFSERQTTVIHGATDETEYIWIIGIELSILFFYIVIRTNSANYFENYEF